jgi:hypothetical protein
MTDRLARIGDSSLATEESLRQPDDEMLIAWEREGGAEATDGCWVEPDGHCEHGKPSWLLKLGIV